MSKQMAQSQAGTSFAQVTDSGKPSVFETAYIRGAIYRVAKADDYMFLTDILAPNSGLKQTPYKGESSPCYYRGDECEHMGSIYTTEDKYFCSWRHMIKYIENKPYCYVDMSQRLINEMLVVAFENFCSYKEKYYCIANANAVQSRRNLFLTKDYVLSEKSPLGRFLIVTQYEDNSPPCFFYRKSDYHECKHRGSKFCLNGTHFFCTREHVYKYIDMHPS